MTTEYQQAERGRTIFGTGLLFFSQGLIWFDFSSPGGIFTVRHLNINVAFLRAEIVIGLIVAAYGVLVWRSASRKLSVANYIIVSSCVLILLLCVSKISEWVYVLNKQNRYAAGIVIAIAMPVCIFGFAAGWADSTYLRERFHAFLGSSRSAS